VLVHGIAQEQASADSLEADWLPNLAGGVRVAGYAQAADRIWRRQAVPDRIDVRMAFYGDCFLSDGVQGGGDLAELNEDQRRVAEELALAWLTNAASFSTDAEDRQQAVTGLTQLSGETGEVQGRRVRSAIGHLVRIRWFAPYGFAFAERFVWKALSQVTRYFTDAELRLAILQRVAALTGPDTIALVGHSLGSVVAYEAAHRMTHRLPLLVTLGSPLGMRPIVFDRLRPQPPAVPAQLMRWVNVADHDDYIAADPDLHRLFPPDRAHAGAVLEGTYTVENGAQPHSALFYLTKRVTGRPIGEALIAMQGNELPQHT
jgi:hypothetical protein